MNTQIPVTLADLVKPKVYLSCAETAKLLRRALKEAFPEVKFSVRSDNYAGGASIRIRWIDGPIKAQVDAIAKAFEGAGFDGMQDLKYFKNKSMNGQRVSFGADYVFSSREEDAEKVSALTAILEKAGKDNWLELAVRMGDKSCRICDCYNAREAAFYLYRSTPPAQFEGRRSALADSITYLPEEDQ